jgi:hypothetical protein
LASRLPAWESKLAKDQTAWVTLDPSEMVSTKKSNKLEKQPDLSILALGAEGKQDFTITAKTTLAVITGLRLEALTDSRIPANGPGRSGGGNFVVSELEATFTPAGGQPQKITFGDAVATYSQGGYDIKGAINGKAGGEPDGWAIFPEGQGKTQTAVLRCKDPVNTGATGGTVKIVIKQQYTDGKHLLGRFRLALTGSAAPVNFGLPAPVLEVLALAPDKRTPEQTKVLLGHLRSTDADLTSKQAALAEANKPLPPDPQLETLKKKLAKAEMPVPVDAVLASLRRDAELSRTQLQNKRLTAAQDLAWALINNPAFLFNH